jgi:hypothetical protein
VTRPLPKRPSQTPATGDVAVDAALADQEMLDDANTVSQGGAPSTLTPTQQATANDDWAKVAAWDVTDAAGKPVTTLDQLAEVLGTDRTTAAGALLNSPMGAAAPQELTAEATEEVNPSGASLYGEFDDVLPDQAAAGFDEEVEEGEEEPVHEEDEGDVEDEVDPAEEEDEDDDTPAFIKGKKGEKSMPRAGTLVTWAKGLMRGRVELMVTNGGTVPGVTDGLVGTKDLPVARVRLYEKDAGCWVPTDRRTAVDARVLSVVGGRGPEAVIPLGQRDISARLVLKVAQHAGPAGSGKPTAEAIREVYRRGMESWPGEAKTLLSAQEWALGRVEAFVEKAEGYDVEHYVGDDDLLP